MLVVRAGALGDLLLLRRAIAALQAAGHRVQLLAPAAPGTALVGPGAGEVDAVLPWDGPEAAALLCGEDPGGPVTRALRSADAVVAFTRSASVLAAVSSRSRRLLAWDPAPPSGGPHASVWLARSLEPLGVDARSDPPPLVFTEAEHRDAEERTRGLPRAFVAVHPGSGSPSKNWPAERVAAVARRLAGDAPWLIVRGPAEKDRPVPDGAVDAREWPLRTLGAVLARAGVFLGNDSGVGHLAAASGAPTLALFGPTDPAVWAPVGRAVSTLRAPSRAVADLGVAEVVAAAGALRSAASGPPCG
ncbi:MAG TPA: glycosyltransferase family 9 protein [Vicinamibacteria bacterium]|nr:glycosyltransferase family 9 protein [Vicinamibacteria bacterium]